MKDRLQKVIDFKTGGKQTSFAKLLGWTPQYLAKLLKGDNFGIQPVITLLSTFRDIDARWFLLGEGQMLSGTDIRQGLFAHIQNILEIERYMPYMEAQELYEFEQSINKGEMPVFSPESVLKWQMRADEKERELNVKFAVAGVKSDELCKQQTAKK